MSSPEDLKSAIVTLLNERQQIGMNCELSCYSDNEGFYYVDYIYSTETVETLTLTDRERKMITDEEELIEIFDNPEEAADFYLRVTGNKMFVSPNGLDSKKKRSVKEKVGASSKNMYFD